MVWVECTFRDVSPGLLTEWGVFGPVRRLRAGGPAPVGDGVSMACSPALGLSPRP